MNSALHGVKDMRTVRGKYSGFWSARDVLYYYCPVCGRHLPWQIYAGSSTLVASCCSYVYNARPLNDGSRFELFVSQADISNVVIFSIVDCDYGA